VRKRNPTMKKVIKNIMQNLFKIEEDEEYEEMKLTSLIS
jgi:hypothetical protein